MTTYLFAAPLLPGKTETWQKYVREMQGPRQEEWTQSRQRAGLTREQVWLEKSPQGDIVVVYYEGDNPSNAIDYMMKSNEPFDKWFRDKILIECHGMDPSNPSMPKNEMIVDGQFAKTGDKKYEETRKGR